MKKLLILATMLAVAVFLSGCQNSDDSKSSSSEQGDGEQASGMGSEGSMDDSDDSCGDDMDDDDACGDDMDDDDACGDDMDDDDACGDDMDDDGMGDDDACGDDMDDDGMGDDDACGDDMDDDGMGDDGDGNGGVPQPKAGTAEYAVLQTWMAIKKGELTGLAEFISLRAKGELAALRDGKLTAERLADLKQQMAIVKLLKPRTSGSSKTISLQNKEGRIFKFTCRKEAGKYVIREFVIKEPPKSKRKSKRRKRS